jgi:alcohol dehydrogenase
VEEVPDPSLPGDSGAIATVDRTAICGSDLHLDHGAMGGNGVRLGHEFIGTVQEIGDDVNAQQIGDRVLVSGVIGCGTCLPCRSRDPVACRNGGPKVFGTNLDLPGGQAEAAAVPAADAFALPIPESLVASGRLHPENVFTHRMGLSDDADAYRIFDDREDGVLKVLLDPKA